MTKLEPILFVPDAHHPFADMKAWNLMLKVGRALKPHHLVVMGDLADFYAVSSHSKDPSRRASLIDEVECVGHRLDELDALGATNKLFVEGNHEDRLTRYLSDRAPELFGLVSTADLLGLKSRGYKFASYKHALRLGKLWITHDVGTAGRYATFKALDTFQHSSVTAHTHRMSYVVEGNAAGEQKLSVTFGWLGDAVQINYMHRFNVLKNWALGFGIGYLDPKTGVCYVTPVPIVKVGRRYTCVVNGSLYEEK
jgi:hypothetical protein